MTSKEVIEALVNVGVLQSIGKEMYFTSKFEKLLSDLVSMPENRLDTPINEVDGVLELYPEPIRKVGKKARMTAIMDYCKVPTMFTMENGKKYMIRTTSIEARRKLDKIINSSKYKPDIVLDTISKYYKSVSTPKGFAKFLVSDFDYLYLSVSDQKDKGENTQGDNFNEVFL
jgi:hypothetical protein